MPGLAADYRLLIPDMPGYGESDDWPEPHTPEALAGILSDGLGSLLAGTEPFTLAGFSFGGLVAGHVARLRGRQVNRLVLIGSGGLALPRPSMAPLTVWRRLPEDEQPAAHRTNLGILMLHDPAAIDSLAVHLQTENARRTRVNSRSISMTDSLRRCLPEVSAPLAGLWGEHDATAKPFIDARRDLLRSFDPDCPFVVVEGAGHWVQYERPEAFHAALREVMR